jgi:hypothetical protein
MDLGSQSLPTSPTTVAGEDTEAPSSGTGRTAGIDRDLRFVSVGDFRGDHRARAPTSDRLSVPRIIELGVAVVGAAITVAIVVFTASRLTNDVETLDANVEDVADQLRSVDGTVQQIETKVDALETRVGEVRRDLNEHRLEQRGAASAPPPAANRNQ